MEEMFKRQLGSIDGGRKRRKIKKKQIKYPKGFIVWSFESDQIHAIYFLKAKLQTFNNTNTNVYIALCYTLFSFSTYSTHIAGSRTTSFSS